MIRREPWRLFIREAVYNALGHNNYAASVPIQIRIEEDAMYISNNCILPKNWTVETLMEPHKSVPFNPSIANAFYRAGYIEAWGRGIQKICESCRELGIDDPKYIVLGDDLTVKFTALKSAIVQDERKNIQENTQDERENIQDENENTQDDTQDKGENTQDNIHTDKARRILAICKEPKSKQEIAELLGYKTIKSVKMEMDELLKLGKLDMTIPNKPKSKNQKYVTAWRL